MNTNKCFEMRKKILSSAMTLLFLLITNLIKKYGHITEIELRNIDLHVLRCSG